MKDRLFNVFVVHKVLGRVFVALYSDTPAEKAEEIAKSYIGDRWGAVRHEHSPTEKHPNLWGINTGCDFVVHYFKD